MPYTGAFTEKSATGGDSMPVTVQDSTSGILDPPFLRELSTPTLASDTIIGLRDIDLTPGHGLTSPSDLGLIVELADPSDGTFFMQCEITAIVGDQVTLDCPVNRVYPAATALVAVSDREMNVNGLITPVLFTVLPFAAQSGDMVRIMFEMQDDAPMDFETFGARAALANGIVVRLNKGDGTYRNLYNFKSNGDIINQCFDHDFFLNNGGNVRGFSGRLSWGGWSKHGAVIRLDGSLSQSLEVIVQDDLTTVSRVRITAQGSEIIK